MLEPELEINSPPDGVLATSTKRAPRHAHKTSSWTATEVRTFSHTHDWTVRGFSECECRYLETNVNVNESVRLLCEVHCNM